MGRSYPLSRRSWSSLAALTSCYRCFLSAGAVFSLALLGAGQTLVAQENPAAVNAVWVAESAGVLKVATADGSLLLEVPGLTSVRAVAVDHHRPTLWLYAGQNVYAYGYDGTQKLVVPVALPNPSNAALAVNEHDGSIWLGADQNLVSVSASGQVLQSLRLADNVESLAIDAAGELLWVGTASTAAAYDAVSGAQVSALDLGSSPDLRDLDLDPSGKVWVALKSGVRSYAEDGTLLLAAVVAAPLHVAGDGHGGAWVATAKDVLQLGPAGQVTASLSPLGGQGQIVEVVLDPSNGDAWVANDRAVAQVDAGGHLVRAFQFQPPVHIWDLALYADVIPPQLAITAPADGSYLNSKTPTISVTYSDVGSGVNPATLAFTANGSPLQVSCTTGATSASCVVATPFPEGPEAVSATVKDYADNTAQAATVTFTIDTIPPAITVTQPASGLVTNQPSQTFVGVLSEPATLTINGAAAAVNASLGFGQPVQLIEGPNTVTLVATDRAGNVGQLVVTVTLDTIPPAPMSASRVTVSAPSGGQVTLTAGAGSAEPGVMAAITDTRSGQTVSVTVAADGSFNAALPAQAGDALSIVLTDAAGNHSAATVVTVPGGQPPGIPPDPSQVAPPLDATIANDLYAATQFLYSGPTPIQAGVGPAVIDPLRVAVVRGRVLDRSGNGLSGAAISILGHAEYGSTTSRADGMYDLVVNGGGIVKVQVQKSGYLPALRQVRSVWRRFVSADDAVLVPYDAAATAVTASAGALQVARGSQQQDAAGSRQATVLFPPGTGISMVLADGSRQSLPAVTVRATEYTVGPSGPAAMPAPLPLPSAYTYAVDLGADEAVAAGARSLVFSQPVVLYVENFLGFPVGSGVPVGTLDPSSGTWTGLPDGRVLAILSIAGGLASLDLTGSGAPAGAADLAALGITDAERATLAGLYPPGQQLWRVPVPHFTTFDLNWNWYPPTDATPPDQPPPGPQARPENQPDCDHGSIIDCENQALGESYPLAGSPFGLTYRSDRTTGRLDWRRLVVPVTGATVPASLKRVDVRVDIAGQIITQSLSPAPNQTFSTTWNGLDAYGRLVHGTTPALVEVGYVYDALYSPATASQPINFAAGTGIDPFGPHPVVAARSELVYRQDSTVYLVNRDIRPLGASGWSLTPHHVLDPLGGTLLLGDGSAESFTQLQLSGVSPFPPPPVPVLFNQPQMLVDAAGEVYFIWSAAQLGNVIQRLNLDGTVTLIAGNGQRGFAGDGGSALGAEFFDITIILADSQGNLYIPDNGRIRKIGADGTINTVAGNGQIPTGANVPDGSVATDVAIAVSQIFLDANDRLFIEDGDTIWRLDGAILRKVWVTTNPVSMDREGTFYWVGSGLASTVVWRWRQDGVHAPEIFSTDPLVALLIGGQPAGNDGFYTQLPNFFGGGSIYHLHRDATYEKLVTVTGFFVGTDPLGNFWINDSNGYQTYGLGVTEVLAAPITIPAPDAETAFVFDRQGRHIATRNTRTGALVHSFAYNGSDLATITDGDGNVTQIERSGGVVSAIVTPYGQRTTAGGGANGLTLLQDPVGNHTNFTYAQGLLASMTDPRGGLYQFSYDPDGRLVRDADPAGGFKTLALTTTASGYSVDDTDALGRKTTYAVTPASGGSNRVITLPSGLSVSELVGDDYSFSAVSPDGTNVSVTTQPDPRFGALAPEAASARITLPSGMSWQADHSVSATLANQHDPLSLTSLTERWSFNNREFTSTFDAASRSYQLVTPALRRETWTVDAQDRPLSWSIPGLSGGSFAYDGRGRLTMASQGSGTLQRTLSLGYDSNGFVKSLSDSAGSSVGFTYDQAGRLTLETLPDGGTVSFQYDANGNLTFITPPGRPAHAFTYTGVDLLGSYAPPALGSGASQTTWGYDTAREVTQVTRPDGRAVSVSYDGAGRPSAINFERGQIAFSYSPVNGHLSSLSSPDGEQMAVAYDGALATGITLSGPIAGTVSGTFDQDLRLSTLSVNGVQSADFAYDLDGLLVQAGLMTLNRDPQTGLLTGTVFGSLATTQAYDSLGELGSEAAFYGSTPLLSVTYQRDNDGRISGKTETVGGTTSTYAYGYDVSGRLTDVQLGGQPLAHYGFDANGNRTSIFQGSTATAATYDAQDRLVQVGNVAYTYTANGDLASKTQNGSSVSYAYDSLGNLVTVIDASGIRTDYIVDGRNRRVGKRVNGVAVQGFLWQDQLKIAAELDGAGNVVSSFVYATHVNVPDYMVKNGVYYRVLTDQLGSPRLVVDATTGEIAQRLDYDAWGSVVLDTNPGFQPFGFAGGLYDSRTGLVRFGARDYDPQAGRWTTKDPTLFAGLSSNLYGYSFDDPVNIVDREGRNPIAIAGAGVVTAGAALVVGLIAYEYWINSPQGKEWLRDHFNPGPILFPMPWNRPGAPGRSCPKPTAIPGARPRVTPPPALTPGDPADRKTPRVPEPKKGGLIDDLGNGLGNAGEDMGIHF